MTTYWTVVVLVIGAAVLVMLAFWHHLSPGGSRRPRRWVALGTSFTPTPGVRSWVAAIDVDRETEGIDLTVAGATVSGLVAGQLGPALAAGPSAAVIWLGPGDLLFGTPLTTFLRELTAVIGRLQRQGCQVLLVGMPDLPGNAAPAGQNRKATLAGPWQAWRQGIQETARLTGALVIPVSVLGGGERQPLVSRITGTIVWLDPPRLEAAGRRISPVLADTLRDGQAGTATERWDEPADPVQRRRLGLPPVR